MSAQSFSAIHSASEAAPGGRVGVWVELIAFDGGRARVRISESEALAWIGTIKAAIESGREHVAAGKRGMP